MNFVECDSCRSKPGDPLLCAGCYSNRALISNIDKKVKDIRGRLTDDFPELAFVGGAYTIKMLDDDLKRVLSLIG